MGGSFVRSVCTPLCSSKSAMACCLPSSKTWKSFLSRLVTGSSLLLVTTTSTRTTLTFDWKGGTLPGESGTAVWESEVTAKIRTNKRKKQRHEHITVDSNPNVIINVGSVRPPAREQLVRQRKCFPLHVTPTVSATCR